MSSLDQELFDEAVLLALDGQRDEAYRQMRWLTQQYPQSVQPWLWLAYTTPDLREAEGAINRAKLVAPGHETVAAAQDWLALMVKKN